MKTKTKAAELPIWKQPPTIGERWRRRYHDGRRETRTVVERTLGGHVNFVSGRWTRFARIETITLEHWREWQANAKPVKAP